MNYHAIRHGASVPGDMQRLQWRRADLRGIVDVLKANTNSTNTFYTSCTNVAADEEFRSSIDPYAAMRTRDNIDEYD